MIERSPLRYLCTALLIVLSALNVEADRRRPIALTTPVVNAARPVSEIETLIPSLYDSGAAIAAVDDGFLVLSSRVVRTRSSIYLSLLPDKPDDAWPATGLRIDGPLGHKGSPEPAFAWSGDRALVVWLDRDELSGRIVFADGAMSPVLSFGPLFADSSHAPRVAWNGTSFVVVGQAAPGAAIRIVLVDPEGNLISVSYGPVGIPVASATLASSVLVALVDGCTAFGCETPLRLTTIATDGIASYSVCVDKVLGYLADQRVDILPDNDRWLVAAADEVEGGSEVSVRVVDHDLAVSENSVRRFTTGARVRLAALGGQRLLFVLSAAQIESCTLSTAGSIGSPVAQFRTSGSNDDFMVSCSSECLMVHSGWRARRLSPGLIADPDDFGFALIAPPQEEPAVAVSGDHALVAWSERVGEIVSDGGPARQRTRIISRRFRLDGSPAGPAVVVGYGRLPDVAGTRSGWLVSWDNEPGSRAMFRRIAPDGAFNDPGPVPVSTTPESGRPVFTSNDESLLLTWFDPTTGELWGSVQPAEAPAVFVQGLPLGGGTKPRSSPTAMWNGEEWLVVWYERWANECVDLLCHEVYRVMGNRVTADGFALETFIIGESATNWSEPLLGTLSGSWIVGWRENERDYRFARVDPTGQVRLDSAPTATTCNEPSIVSGGRWLGITCTRLSGKANDAVYVPLRLGREVALDDPVPVATTPEEERGLVAASAGAAILAAYVAEDTSPEAGGSARLFVAGITSER